MARSSRQKRLAEILAAQRSKLGLNQADVAQKMGRQQPFIANIESGQRRVDVGEFITLAEILGLDPAKVLRELKKLPP